MSWRSRIKTIWDRSRVTLGKESLATPLSIFVGSRIALYALLLLFTGLLPGEAGGKPTFWQMMTQWDGIWYLRIARNGYQWLGPATQSTAGFFPLYSMLGRAAGWLVGDLDWGLLLVTNISFALYLYFVYQYVRLEGDKSWAERTLVYIAAFPTAFVFATFYAEATSLACVAGAMLFARRGRFRIAIPLAFLATLTRLPALAVIFPIAYEMWKQRGFKRELLALVLIPLGTVAFCVYLWHLSGDPFAYFSIQRTAWFHLLTPPWETLRLALDRMTWPLNDFVTSLGLLEGGSILLVLALTIGVLRTRPPGEWLYALAILSLVLVQTVDVDKGPPTIGAPRYLMASIPAFIVLGHMGENRYLDQSIRWTFLILQGIFAIYFFAHLWVV